MQVAYAVVRDPEEPAVYLAEDIDVLSRVVALHVVAATPAHLVGARKERIRDALLDEQWGTAVFEWMEATGSVVDVYPAEDVWTNGRLDSERASFELRMAPLFADD